jgi:glyoxylase-like metal-dependent hydrolase (beta-lactamase superfamily II)
LTHIHLDHAGATGALVNMLPNAQVYVHRLGAPHLIDPTRLVRSATRIYGEQMRSLWGEIVPVPQERLHVVDDGDEIVIGSSELQVLYTPGHAVHHVAFFDERRGLLFPGDVAGVRLEDPRLVRPPTPPPDLSLEDWYASLDRILALRPQRLFLPHFGPVDEVEAHITELRERLRAWGDLALEDMRAIERIVHATRALFVVAITEPASLGALEPPGAYDADIVAAEGQSLGNAHGYGGPALGLFATREEFVRRLPGRLVGRTIDNRGQDGYVLTLQTREQHIRRERATSNICTNQALLAVAASVYLATLGKQGFAELGSQCLRRAHYAQRRITAIPGFAPLFNRPYFDEFAVKTPHPPAEINTALRDLGIVGGYDLSKDYPELGDAMLFCVTETRTREEIETLAAALEEIVGGGHE